MGDQPLGTGPGIAPRDRHARRDNAATGVLLPRSVPRHRTRSQRFDDAVLAAYAPLAERFAGQLDRLDLAVDTVPRMRLRADLTMLPDEVFAEGPVPLGRVIPAGVDAQGHPTRARIVIFRMPVEQRCSTRAERADLLGIVLTALVANHLNLSPWDIDPDFPR